MKNEQILLAVAAGYLLGKWHGQQQPATAPIVKRPTVRTRPATTQPRVSPLRRETITRSTQPVIMPRPSARLSISPSIMRLMRDCK